MEYKSDDFVSLEGLKLADGGDFVGKSNETTPFAPLPEIKSNVFARWGNEFHRVGLTARYVDGYRDNASDTPENLRNVGDFITYDMTYVNNMMDDVAISLSVLNLLDEDPPQVANDLNYDPYNTNPFGRMIKLGVVYSPDFLQ